MNIKEGVITLIQRNEITGDVEYKDAEPDEYSVVGRSQKLLNLGKIEEVGFFILDDDFYVMKRLYVNGANGVYKMPLAMYSGIELTRKDDRLICKDMQVIYHLMIQCVPPREIVTDQRFRMHSIEDMQRVIDILRGRYPVQNPYKKQSWQGVEYLY